MSLLNRLIKISFGLAIFTIPLQVNLLIYQSEWARGFINPYTSVYFSITEVFLLLAGILFFIKLKKEKAQLDVGHKIFFMLLLGIVVIIGISIFFSSFQDPTFKLLLFAKILELLLLYLLIVNKAAKPRNILEIFIVSMSLQALLAIVQVITQHSLGLQILGEPNLSQEAAHIARFSLGDFTLIRAYGVFTHPNILGGFLVISLLSSLLFSPHLKYERTLLTALQFLGLLATFSRSAILAFTIAIFLICIWYLPLIKQFKNKFIPALLGVIFLGQFLFLALSRGINIMHDPAFIERIAGYKIALGMFLQHPFGVGFGHFTLFMDEISLTNLAPWEYQPVHNVLLLSLTETGIFGFSTGIIIAIFAAMKLWSKRKKLLTKEQKFKKHILLAMVFSLFTIGLLDHYLISLEQGRLMLILAFAIISSFSANPRHILPIKKGENLNKILLVQK